MVPEKPALELSDVHRTYLQGGAEIVVLDGVSLSIKPGEMVALVGPSGAGKSTLLHIAGLLERPDSGVVNVHGEDCSALSDVERSRVRCRWLGFVYQYHHLLPEFSALENIVLPQMIAEVPRKIARERAGELLRGMGLLERASHRPGKLSGGEQQRVAIARAIANGPLVLLADEPTGNLDHHTADNVFAQLLELVRVAGIGALVATHNLELAARMDRIAHIQDGKISE
ncbi:MAG: ABC transporter ATP-binding protein [Pseudomonadota bacterium]